MEFSRQEYWSELLFPSWEDIPNPRIKPGSPALKAHSLPLSHLGSPSNVVVVVQSLSCVQLFVILWIEACQASLSYTISWSLLKFMSIESMIPSNHLSHPLSPCSPPALNLCLYQGLFQWVNSSYQVAKVLELQLQHQSFQWIFRTDLL